MAGGPSQPRADRRNREGRALVPEILSAENAAVLMFEALAGGLSLDWGLIDRLVLTRTGIPTAVTRLNELPWRRISSGDPASE